MNISTVVNGRQFPIRQRILAQTSETEKAPLRIGAKVGPWQTLFNIRFRKNQELSIIRARVGRIYHLLARFNIFRCSVCKNADQFSIILQTLVEVFVLLCDWWIKARRILTCALVTKRARFASIVNWYAIMFSIRQIVWKHWLVDVQNCNIKGLQMQGWRIFNRSF